MVINCYYIIIIISSINIINISSLLLPAALGLNTISMVTYHYFYYHQQHHYHWYNYNKKWYPILHKVVIIIRIIFIIPDINHHLKHLFVILFPWKYHVHTGIWNSECSMRFCDSRCFFSNNTGSRVQRVSRCPTYFPRPQLTIPSLLAPSSGTDCRSQWMANKLWWSQQRVVFPLRREREYEWEM